MAQLDTRIPMQVPNVLGMRQQVAQTNALNANTLAQGFDAVQRGMEAPMRRNMLAAQVQGAGIQNTQQEQAMLGQVLDKVAGNPETWGAARQFLVGNGIFEEGELPEQLTEQTFRELSAVAFTPAEELTDWQRKMQYLTPEQRQQAALVSTGIYPDANAMLRGQTGDKPTTAMQEYAAAVDQGFKGTLLDWKNATRGNGVTVSPDGTVTVGGSPLGRAGENEIDKRTINTADALARVRNIRTTSSNPALADMNTLQGELKRRGLEWQDYLSPESLSDDDRQYLADVTTARADIIENVNFTIQAMTGAAVGVDEEVRLRATIPDVKDSPTQFASKLERLEKRLTASIARYHMWKNQGSVGEPWKMAPLTEVERQMDSRLNDLNTAVESGDITEQEADALFASEFGL